MYYITDCYSNYYNDFLYFRNQIKFYITLKKKEIFHYLKHRDILITHITLYITNIIIVVIKCISKFIFECNLPMTNVNYLLKKLNILIVVC